MNPCFPASGVLDSDHTSLSRDMPDALWTGKRGGQVAGAKHGRDRLARSWAGG